jgi:hypothetical protein
MLCSWKPLLKGCTTEAIFSTAHLILSSLLCAIDEMMEVIDPARRPSPPQRRTNVSSLPEEILTQIFHEAFPATVSADQNDWDKKRARIRRLLRLTRVNTRFHHIIHSTISFWTYLYESMDQRESRFTLQKLRAAGPSIEITVELFIPEAETNLRGTDFLNCVRPFISQWKRLILVLPPVNVDRTCEWILKNITKENCPKLRTIELFSGCRSGAPVLDLSSLRTTIQNVRTFRVSGLTPCFHCAFSFTTLSLTFTSSKQFEQIFTAIKPVCSTLETFEITLNSNRLLTGDSDPGFEEELRRQADEVAFSHPSQAIKFTRLRELTLVLIGPSYILSGEKFQDVLETLLSNNPLLETVTIEIQGEYGGTADSFLRVLVTWINQQHSLRELYFDACRVVPNSQLFRGASSYESVLPLLASHPNLSKLVLSGDAFGKPLRVMDLEPLPDSFVVNCPLQTLILTGFSTFDGLPLLRGIRQGANWALFQRLDIRGASCFAHTSDITAIIPEQLLRTDEYIPGSHGGWKHVPKGARNSEKFVLGTLDSDSTADVEYELRTTSSWVGMVRSQDTDENYASNF